MASVSPPPEQKEAGLLIWPEQQNTTEVIMLHFETLTHKTSSYENFTTMGKGAEQIFHYQSINLTGEIVL